MSRLTSMSPAALKALFSPDSSEQLITLVTLTSGAEVVRLADGFTQRLSETEEDVIYGVRSRGQDFVFLPIEIGLPSDEDGAAPRAQLTIHNVTRYLTPFIRGLVAPPRVDLEIVLASSPDTVEVSFGGMSLASVTYSAETVQGNLTVDTLALEPFPAHTFTPNWFPGMF